MKKIKSGFTLAEVLITLAIIGIIAALVMPTIIASYQYKTIGVKLSKFAVNIENAARAYVVSENSLTDSAKINTFLKSVLTSDSSELQSQGKGANYTCTDADISSNSDIEECRGKAKNTVVFRAVENGANYIADNIINNFRFKDLSSVQSVAPTILKDGVKVVAYELDPTTTSSYSIVGVDYSKTGRVALLLSIDPQISGMPGGTQKTYNFVVTELGYVYPHYQDKCLQKIKQDGWVTKADTFAEAADNSNIVCNENIKS